MIFNMEVEDLVNKYLRRYRYLIDIKPNEKDKYPPWAIRKYIEMSGALIHPDLQRELFILSLCSHDSIWIARNLLQSYFAWSYKLTTESSFSIVMYLSGEDFSVLSPFSQLDGITYSAGSTDGPAGDPRAYDINAISDTARDEANLGKDPVTIRLGHSAHKTDLIWFVKKYWHEIENQIDRPDADRKQIRHREATIRNIREYSMRISKVDPEERMSDHEARDGYAPDYDTLNSAYKESMPNAKRNPYGPFSLIFEQIKGMSDFQLRKSKYHLRVDNSSEAPFLYLEHM
jgi:hypothetical protein